MSEGSGSGYLGGMLIRSRPLCFCDMQWLKSPGCIPLWVIKDVTLSLGKHITTGFHCEHHMPSDPVYATWRQTQQDGVWPTCWEL